MSLVPLLLLSAAAYAVGAALLVAAGAACARAVPAEGRAAEAGGKGSPADGRVGRRAAWALREAISLAPAALVVGLVALHALLLAYDAAGVPWRRRTLAAGMAALFLAAAVAAVWRVLRRRAASDRRAIPDEEGSAETSRASAPGLDHVSAETSAGSAPAVGPFSAETSRPSALATAPLPPRRLPFGWGDLVALAALAVYTGAAYTRRIGIPDFVYHWGLKAKRYALTGGIDWAWLGDPLRLTDHPDYPNLLPGLYAASAHVLGTFDEGGLLLWSAVFFALMVLFARRAVAALPGRFAPQATVATLALAVGMFGIGYDMAGGADWLVALALLAAAPVLLRPPGEGEGAGRGHADDLLVGAAAALAAGAKIEGVPLATFLVAAHLLRLAAAPPFASGAGPFAATSGALAAASPEAAAGRAAGPPAATLAARLRRLAGAAPWVLVPPALVIVPWLAGNLRHGLFQATNTGTWDAERLGAVAAGLATSLGTAEWHGLPWLLVLLPVLVAVRRTRVLAAVLALQLLLYVAIYLTAPVDTGFYVLSSFPRLAFHLVPALLVALAVLLVPPRQGSDPA